MKRLAQEFKVGLFIIICLAGLAYLIISTGKISFGKQGYNIYVVFTELAGLNKKAPVMLNGVEVGKVDDLKIAYDFDKTLITLKLSLNNDVKVRQGSEISIKTLGMMGEKFIQITSSQSSEFMPADTVVCGKPYLDIDTLVSNLNATMDQNKDRFNNIAKNMETTSKNFEAFSDDIKRHPWKLLIKTKENRKN